MLRSLSIQNYLLIQSAEISLHDGFTVLTGETGSGKSMLISALQLVLGNRADGDLLGNPQERCIIELEVDASHLNDWFVEMDLPFELITSVRRQIEVNGRSRAFVNDTPVRLEILRALGDKLVHIHSQHQTAALSNKRTILRMLDRSAGLEVPMMHYHALYGEMRQLKAAIKQMEEQVASPAQDVDYLQFQFEELNQAQLTAGQLQELEQELARAERSGELIHTCELIAQTLDGDQGTLNVLYDLQRRASDLANADAAFAGYSERLRSCYLELKDLHGEVESHGSGLEMDPKRAEWLRDRVDSIQRLMQKHRVRHEQELLDLQQNLAEKIQAAGKIEEEKAQLKAQLNQIEDQVRQAGKKLSALRQQSAPLLANTIRERLYLLGMPKARFALELEASEPDEMGMDSISALFAADPDRPLGDISQVASGGELSRIMLALISPTAKAMEVSTIIFDEIDTGVSGEVADKVGNIMSSMADGLQVMAITHLPQVASKAEHHLYTSKALVKGSTRTAFRYLDKSERIQAVAEMLSGSSTSPAALENARELLVGNN